MTTSSRRSDWFSRRLLPAAALALAPKCLLCGLAYAGLFGVGGAELCGETPADWPHGLALAAGALGALAFLLAARAPRRAPSITSRASCR
jgi:hypothetical protein